MSDTPDFISIPDADAENVISYFTGLNVLDAHNKTAFLPLDIRYGEYTVSMKVANIFRHAPGATTNTLKQSQANDPFPVMPYSRYLVYELLREYVAHRNGLKFYPRMRPLLEKLVHWVVVAGFREAGGDRAFFVPTPSDPTDFARIWGDWKNALTTRVLLIRWTLDRIMKNWLALADTREYHYEIVRALVADPRALPRHHAEYMGYYKQWLQICKTALHTEFERKNVKTLIGMGNRPVAPPSQGRHPEKIAWQVNQNRFSLKIKADQTVESDFSSLVGSTLPHFGRDLRAIEKIFDYPEFPNRHLQTFYDTHTTAPLYTPTVDPTIVQADDAAVQQKLAELTPKIDATDHTSFDVEETPLLDGLSTPVWLQVWGKLIAYPELQTLPDFKTDFFFKLETHIPWTSNFPHWYSFHHHALTRLLQLCTDLCQCVGYEFGPHPVDELHTTTIFAIRTAAQTLISRMNEYPAKVFKYVRFYVEELNPFAKTYANYTEKIRNYEHQQRAAAATALSSKRMTPFKSPAWNQRQLTAEINRGLLSLGTLGKDVTKAYEAMIPLNIVGATPEIVNAFTAARNRLLAIKSYFGGTPFFRVPKHAHELRNMDHFSDSYLNVTYPAEIDKYQAFLFGYSRAVLSPVALYCAVRPLYDLATEILSALAAVDTRIIARLGAVAGVIRTAKRVQKDCAAAVRSFGFTDILHTARTPSVPRPRGRALRLPIDRIHWFFAQVVIDRAAVTWFPERNVRWADLIAYKRRYLSPAVTVGQTKIPPPPATRGRPKSPIPPQTPFEAVLTHPEWLHAACGRISKFAKGPNMMRRPFGGFLDPTSSTDLPAFLRHFYPEQISGTYPQDNFHFQLTKYLLLQQYGTWSDFQADAENPANLPVIEEQCQDLWKTPQFRESAEFRRLFTDRIAGEEKRTFKQAITSLFTPKKGGTATTPFGIFIRKLRRMIWLQDDPTIDLPKYYSTLYTRDGANSEITYTVIDRPASDGPERGVYLVYAFTQSRDSPFPSDEGISIPTAHPETTPIPTESVSSPLAPKGEAAKVVMTTKKAGSVVTQDDAYVVVGYLPRSEWPLYRTLVTYTADYTRQFAKPYGEYQFSASTIAISSRFMREMYCQILTTFEEALQYTAWQWSPALIGQPLAQMDDDDEDGEGEEEEEEEKNDATKFQDRQIQAHRGWLFTVNTLFQLSHEFGVDFSASLVNGLTWTEYLELLQLTIHQERIWRQILGDFYPGLQPRVLDPALETLTPPFARLFAGDANELTHLGRLFALLKAGLGNPPHLRRDLCQMIAGLPVPPATSLSLSASALDPLWTGLDRQAWRFLFYTRSQPRLKSLGDGIYSALTALPLPAALRTKLDGWTTRAYDAIEAEIPILPTKYPTEIVAIRRVLYDIFPAIVQASVSLAGFKDKKAVAAVFEALSKFALHIADHLQTPSPLAYVPLLEMCPFKWIVNSQPTKSDRDRQEFDFPDRNRKFLFNNLAVFCQSGQKRQFPIGGALNRPQWDLLETGHLRIRQPVSLPALTYHPLPEGNYFRIGVDQGWRKAIAAAVAKFGEANGHRTKGIAPLLDEQHHHAATHNLTRARNSHRPPALRTFADWVAQADDNVTRARARRKQNRYAQRLARRGRGKQFTVQTVTNFALQNRRARMNDAAVKLYGHAIIDMGHRLDPRPIPPHAEGIVPLRGEIRTENLSHFTKRGKFKTMLAEWLSGALDHHLASAAPIRGVFHRHMAPAYTSSLCPHCHSAVQKCYGVFIPAVPKGSSVQTLARYEIVGLVGPPYTPADGATFTEAQMRARCQDYGSDTLPAFMRTKIAPYYLGAGRRFFANPALAPPGTIIWRWEVDATREAGVVLIPAKAGNLGYCTGHFHEFVLLDRDLLAAENLAGATQPLFTAGACRSVLDQWRTQPRSRKFPRSLKWQMGKLRSLLDQILAGNSFRICEWLLAPPREFMLMRHHIAELGHAQTPPNFPPAAARTYQEIFGNPSGENAPLPPIWINIRNSGRIGGLTQPAAGVFPPGAGPPP